MFSFIIPCYNSEKTIAGVVERVQDVMKKYYQENLYEIILVNDYSKDNTMLTLKHIADQNKEVMAVDLAKNVGQHGAIMAGFNLAKGQYVVTLDDDGQTPIENLKKMMDKLAEGYDVVSAKYITRTYASFFRKLGTKINRRMTRWMIGGPEGVNVSIFLVARHFVVEEIIKYTNPYPYITGLVLRVTHNIANVEMEQGKREIGSSGYSFSKLLHLWMNGFTAFSIKPLRITSFVGGAAATIAVIMAIITIIRKVMGLSTLVGWSSLVVIMLFMSGVILCVLGIIGEYIGRIYMCINDTPQFVVKEIHTSEKTE